MALEHPRGAKGPERLPEDILRASSTATLRDEPTPGRELCLERTKVLQMLVEPRL
jgi:hypothetical protein